MNRALSTQSRTIRIPVNINEKLTKLRAAKARLFQQTGRQPIAEELADYLKLPLDEVEDLLGCELRSVTVSLQAATWKRVSRLGLSEKSVHCIFQYAPVLC